MAQQNAHVLENFIVGAIFGVQIGQSNGHFSANLVKIGIFSDVQTLNLILLEYQKFRKKSEILNKNLKFRSKIWNFSQKSGISVKNLEFRSKIWNFRQKYEILDKNLEFWSKIWNFGQKSGISVKNLEF